MTEVDRRSTLTDIDDQSAKQSTKAAIRANLALRFGEDWPLCAVTI